MKRRSGGMADAMDSKSIVGDNVWVQVPPSAPKRVEIKKLISTLFYFIAEPIVKNIRLSIRAIASFCFPSTTLKFL